jgi:hypothetical protein
MVLLFKTNSIAGTKSVSKETINGKGNKINRQCYVYTLFLRF